MPISAEYLQYVLDQLETSGSITARKMFGGAGLYLDNVFFALIADDVLYFKVDDSNRPDYEKAGMKPFKPFGEKSYIMQYYEVPVAVLDDREELQIWVDKALSVAIRKLSSGKKKRRAHPKQKN
jgi:DNA transformation protein